MFFQGNEKYNCATYLRLSRSDGDQQESNSIKNQRALLNDYMGKHPELHKFDEYVDDGYSGTNFERPDFKRMMQDIEKRNVNCIIVKDLSRFGRNYIETGRYLERIFPFMGVRFIAINDHYDSAEENDDKESGKGLLCRTSEDESQQIYSFDKGYRCFSGKAPFIESEKIFREILSALEKEKMQAAHIDRVLDLNPEKVKQCMDAGLLQYRKRANG